MGGLGSTRWGGYRKRVCVEQCLVLDVRQLRATLGDTLDLTAGRAITFSYTVMPTETRVLCTVWLVTTTRSQGGQHQRMYYPLITNGEPCHRRVEKLYLPPGHLSFGCRQCHNLTYRSCQESHTYDTLAKHMGLTPAQVRQALAAHR